MLVNVPALIALSGAYLAQHVSHVLGKLGAANRTEAVARARELSLIP
jgi:DNA-binding CsgD family transcriptional regulator